MIVKNIDVICEDNKDNKIKLKRVITQKTRPDTDTINNLANGNLGYNNLNSILKNADKDRVVQYIKITKHETAKIDDNIIKEINSNDNSKNERKMSLNINNKNNNKNIDLYFLPKRVDRYGTPIMHNAKHKVTFIDRITKQNFAEVIKVESFKEFNKMEEVSSTRKNNCCLIL